MSYSLSSLNIEKNSKLRLVNASVREGILIIVSSPFSLIILTGKSRELILLMYQVYDVPTISPIVE